MLKFNENGIGRLKLTYKHQYFSYIMLKRIIMLKHFFLFLLKFTDYQCEVCYWVISDYPLIQI